MKAKTKLAVILSDIHVGSTVGLWPDKFKANEGFEIGQNDFQKQLWALWKENLKWIEKIVGKDEFEIIINGDAVEGIHHRTLQVMSPDVADQSVAVLAVLGGLVEKSKALYLTKGTECHTRNDELRIGRELGAIKDPATGHHAWDRLELEFGKVTFTAAHHCSATSRHWLESGEFSRFMASEIGERARCRKLVPQIVARAHRHVPGVFNDGVSIGIVTGGWQGLTRHGNKVVPYAVPRPSCVILDFRNSAPNELPTVHQKVFVTE